MAGSHGRELWFDTDLGDESGDLALLGGMYSPFTSC